MRKSNSPIDTYRDSWQRFEGKKKILRFWIAALFVLVNVVGVELGSPNYSLQHKLATILIEQSPTIGFLAERVLGNPEDDFTTAKNLGHLLKLTFVLGLAVVVLYALSNCDPFHNNSVLRRKANLPLPRSWLGSVFRELAVYARSMPSTVLPQQCLDCRHKRECPSRLVPGNDENVNVWRIIHSTLSGRHAKRVFRRVHQCRKAYYLKYSLISSVAFLSIFYIGMRVFETMYGLQISPNASLLIYIGCLSILCGIISIINQTWKRDGSGVWAKHRDCIREVFSSSEFSLAFSQLVCRRGTRRYSFASELGGSTNIAAFWPVARMAEIVAPNRVSDLQGTAKQIVAMDSTILRSVSNGIVKPREVGIQSGLPDQAIHSLIAFTLQDREVTSLRDYRKNLARMPIWVEMAKWSGVLVVGGALALLGQQVAISF